MKNQQLLIVLLLAAILRNVIPFVDVFLFVLVLLFILNQDSVSLVSLFAVIVSFLYSFFFDSPIGLFPLLLSIHLLVFTSITTKVSGKGIAPLIVWCLLAVSLLFSETLVRLLLTTGALTLQASLFTRTIGTLFLIISTSFVLSFKRKL